ncbi:unnamed protein product, partial [Arabidopsis halleri]
VWDLGFNPRELCSASSSSYLCLIFFDFVLLVSTRFGGKSLRSMLSFVYMGRHSREG